jgi:hypothetical protein
VRFLRGRELPAQLARTLYEWLADAPETRWPVALELEWPLEVNPDLVANLRAMAAAKAIDESSAYGGLVADTARRWLSGASGPGWLSVADAALGQLGAP